jgi:hypothetical protein
MSHAFLKRGARLIWGYIVLAVRRHLPTTNAGGPSLAWCFDDRYSRDDVVVFYSDYNFNGISCIAVKPEHMDALYYGGGSTMIFFLQYHGI